MMKHTEGLETQNWLCALSYPSQLILSSFLTSAD